LQFIVSHIQYSQERAIANGRRQVAGKSIAGKIQYLQILPIALFYLVPDNYWKVVENIRNV
jgi:hypothetical protein